MTSTMVTRRIERLWRCPVCGVEAPVAALEKPARPAWCFGGVELTHVETPTPMTFVERELAFVDARASAIIDLFETSDWGLLRDAVDHYSQNRRRLARRRPGVENALADVFARFNGMDRALGDLARLAGPDSPGGGKLGHDFMPARVEATSPSEPADDIGPVRAEVC